MLSTGKFFFTFVLLLGSLFHPAQAGDDVFIDSPVEGDYLQGAVSISGGMDVQNFTAYEAAFTYEDGRDNPAWFLIKRDINQVQKGALAVWDTTTITDGEYRIRVLVLTGEGRELVKEVRHLHVNNYSPVQGGGAALATLPAGQKAAGQAPFVRPAEVTLPPNPAEISEQDLKASLLRGLGATAALFAGLGLYLLARRGLQKK